MRRLAVIASVTLVLSQLAFTAAAAAPLWVQHAGAVLTPTAPWEQQNVQEPSVEFDAATHTFRMWYTGADEAKCMIGYATSSDGINFVRPLDHPVLGWGYGGVKMNTCHSDVQKLAGRYYAWFSIDSKAYGDENGNLYEATSPDGLAWTPLPKPAIRASKTGWNTHTANSFVVRDRDHWLMFWESFGNGLWRMSTATSSDLIHWKAVTKAPTVTGVGFGDTFGGPWVLRENGGWTMYFHAPAPKVTAPNLGGYSIIYEATSRDLTHWKTNPLPLVTRDQPLWQVDQIADPSVVVADGKRYLYFDGLDNSWPIKSSIGVAVLG